MNDISTYASAILQFLSNMDVKASENNIRQLNSIYTAVGKITELSHSAAIKAREIPAEDKKK